MAANYKDNIYPNELSQTQIASDTALSYPQTGQVAPQLRVQSDLSRQQLESYIATSSAAKGSPGTALNSYQINREPWIFSTFESITQTGGSLASLFSSRQDGYNTSADTIFWVASPKSVSWQVSQRAQEDKNKSGTVLHVWRDRTRKTDYDDPKLVMQFQSGSIHPTYETGGRSGISGGQTNFYQFLELVDQPKIASNGEPNLIHILYRSAIFPSMVLTGFFDPQMVVQFSDDSQNPWQVNAWQASFTVYSTTPRINSFSDLQRQFETEGMLMKSNASFSGTRVDAEYARTGSILTNSI